MQHSRFSLFGPLGINVRKATGEDIDPASWTFSRVSSMMRPSLCFVALAALPGVFSAGVWVINQCPFAIHLIANGPKGPPDISDIIGAGDGYFETYQGDGRAIKLSRDLNSATLVFGYSEDSGAPLVWCVTAGWLREPGG
jgi:hypothetical protein